MIGEYEKLREMAQVLISQDLKNLTVATIREHVQNASKLFPPVCRETQEKLIRELEARFQTVIGEERELLGETDDWDHWLPDRRGQIDWQHWTRYSQYLTKGPMTEDVRERLDFSTDRLLGLLGNPHRKGTWDRRGLVVGLVQSGKTSHYIGLINKAVDAGYKVIVLLTGFTESLRVQSQIRAEEGFLGYYMMPSDSAGTTVARATGVGTIDPRLKPNSVTTRNHDFRKGIAKNFGIAVDGETILFVIKKNVSVLRNLISWIENFGNAVDKTGDRFVKDVPVLVIDDESDVGSIDTRKGNIVDDDADPDHDPSRINGQIRKLLSLFDQSSYVGYTATPFANVLIHDAGFSSDVGEDLFPRSFIVSLPTPSDHIGPAMIFGRNAGEPTEEPGLPIIRHIPDTETTGANAWIPPVHKKTYKPFWEQRNEVPPSLRRAILSFVLVCASRKLRDTGTKHNSMLVHVTRFNDVQEIVHEQVRKELQGVVDRLRAGTANEHLLEELRDLWNDDFVGTTEEISNRDGTVFQNPSHSWQEVKKELLNSASSIQVRTINGLAAEVLDYVEHKDGLNVIAIGGDKLSRGLTLEGLSVSYFLRCSRMYDTLMQMGRWFGYRFGYVDLCRLFTTPDLCNWFGHIAIATEELREEFDLMANSGGTPKDFGLRVRSHPQLMVTSQVKMRHGQTVPVTFQGDLVETLSFIRSSEVVGRNWRSAQNLVRTIKSDKSVPRLERPRANCTMWRNVGADRIIEFLSNYTTHSAATKAQPALLSEYIRKEKEKDRLTEWTVLISGGGGAAYSFCDEKTKLTDRGWKLSGSTEADRANEKRRLIKEGQYRTGSLVNPPDEAVDLSEKEIESALLETIRHWEQIPREVREKKKLKRPTEAGRRFKRFQRNPKRGLLILYFLNPDDKKCESNELPITAFALSFPAVDGASVTNVAYTVNNVAQRTESQWL